MLRDLLQQPGRRFTVLGLSRSGVGAALLLRKHGHQVVISEAKAQQEADTRLLDKLREAGIEAEFGGHSEQALTQADGLITSPGIPPGVAVFQRASDLGLPVFSEVDVAKAFSPAETKWIGITGTNGKTTVTHFVHHLLTQAKGWNAPLCGNVGTAVSQVLLEATCPPRALVTELSSYQLATSEPLGVELAVLTHIKPDHIAWHGSFEAYQAAKLRLFEPAFPRWAVLNALEPSTEALLERRSQAGLPSALFSLQAGHPLLAKADLALWWDEAAQALLARYTPQNKPALNLPDLPDNKPVTLIKRSALALPGSHNVDNALASLACALILDTPLEALKQAVATFKGVEHRLEHVTTLPLGAGVNVYNDSKATNPDASEQAIYSLTAHPTVLLAGGEDKGTSLESWAAACVEHTACVVVYGSARERLKQALLDAGHTQVVTATQLRPALEAALAFVQAHRKALPVNLVLAPACASFDEFKDFEHRGAVFKQAVLHLASTLASPPASKEVTA